jgi:hypothetical protein
MLEHAHSKIFNLLTFTFTTEQLHLQVRQLAPHPNTTVWLKPPALTLKITEDT